MCCQQRKRITCSAKHEAHELDLRSDRVAGSPGNPEGHPLKPSNSGVPVVPLAARLQTRFCYWAAVAVVKVCRPQSCLPQGWGPPASSSALACPGTRRRAAALGQPAPARQAGGDEGKKPLQLHVKGRGQPGGALLPAVRQPATSERCKRAPLQQILPEAGPTAMRASRALS